MLCMKCREQRRLVGEGLQVVREATSSDSMRDKKAALEAGTGLLASMWNIKENFRWSLSQLILE
jgi:hypothetical protein